jgi:hypothetical protein
MPRKIIPPKAKNIEDADTEAYPQNSFRDLLQLKADGYEVDEWQYHVWRVEEEMIRACMYYGAVFGNTGITKDYFEAPIHKLAWEAYELLCEESPQANEFPPTVFLNVIRRFDRSAGLVEGNTGVSWMKELSFETPSPIEYVWKLTIKELHSMHLNKSWATMFDSVKDMQASGHLPAAVHTLYCANAARILIEGNASSSKVENSSTFEWDPEGAGRQRLIPFEIEQLDKFTAGGHGRGELMAVGAGTNVGKSYFAEQLCRLQAEAGRTVLYISTEDETELIKCRMMAYYSTYVSEPGYSPAEFRQGSVDPQIHDEVRTLMRKRHGDRYNFVCCKKGKLSEISQLVRMYRYAKGCSMVVVDYVQAIDGEPKGTESKINETGRVISSLKQLASDCDVALVAFSQLSREGYKHGSEPTINAFKYCGDIENEAEIVVLLWHAGKDDDEHIRSRVAKVKWARVRYRDCVFRVETDTITGAHLKWIELEEDERNIEPKNKRKQVR